MINTEVRRRTGYFRFYNQRGVLVRDAKNMTKHEVRQQLALTGAVYCVHWMRPNETPRAYILSEDGQLFPYALTQVRWDRFEP